MQIEKKNDKTQHLNITTDRTLWTVQSKLKAGSHRPININIQWFVVQCCRLIWQCEPASHHSMTYCQNRQFWKIHLFFHRHSQKTVFSCRMSQDSPHSVCTVLPPQKASTTVSQEWMHSHTGRFQSTRHTVFQPDLRSHSCVKVRDDSVLKKIKEAGCVENIMATEPYWQM